MWEVEGVPISLPVITGSIKMVLRPFPFPPASIPRLAPRPCRFLLYWTTSLSLATLLGGSDTEGVTFPFGSGDLTGSAQAEICLFAYGLWELFRLLLLPPFVWCPFSELSSSLDSSVPLSSERGYSLSCSMDSRFRSSALKASSSRLLGLLSWALSSAISRS